MQWRRLNDFTQTNGTHNIVRPANKEMYKFPYSLWEVKKGEISKLIGHFRTAIEASEAARSIK